MSWIMMHATADDLTVVREWINESPDVAWIVKTGQAGSTHTWQAIERIDLLAEQEYALWHIPSGPLNIPSGKTDVPDKLVHDPFFGWSQELPESSASPWFGANLPGPYSLQFRQNGREHTESIGRSQFYWALDRFKAIGKPANPDAKRWWQQLQRFVAKSATKRPWPEASSRYGTYVFPQALQLHRNGWHLDVNP